jgi:tetratricopeptide (TPR) repeat protein
VTVKAAAAVGGVLGHAGLEADGRRAEAVKVWGRGYEVLGGADPVNAARDSKDTLDLNSSRLMLAFNLGLGYAEIGRAHESMDWFEKARDLARYLLRVKPNDRLVLYEHGMSCANLVDCARGSGRPVDSLHLLREGLTSLEKAIALEPANNYLRGDLGECWHWYADALHSAGQPAAARSAIRMAVRRQVVALLAAPAPDPAARLYMHVRRAVELHTDTFSGFARPAPGAAPRRAS